MSLKPFSSSSMTYITEPITVTKAKTVRMKTPIFFALARSALLRVCASVKNSVAGSRRFNSGFFRLKSKLRRTANRYSILNPVSYELMPDKYSVNFARFLFGKAGSTVGLSG